MRAGTAQILSHLVAAPGLLLVVLACLLAWSARRDDWVVGEGTVVVMVTLFIGGVGLVGLGAIIRQSGRNRTREEGG